MDQNRRQFLKRSAIVGGAVWAAPAIATVSSALAATSTAPGCTTCTGQGTGAYLNVGSLLSVGPLGQGSSQPDNCVASATIPNVAGLTAVCGGFSSSPSCTGDSHVAGNPITVLGTLVQATAISTTAHQSSTCANTGTTVLANASINGGAPVVNLTPAPNFQPLAVLPSGVASLTLNRQCCDASGNFTVRGLELVLLNAISLVTTVLVLAESKVGGCRCACNLPACIV